MSLSLEQLGPYRLSRRLGRGGMGTVYEGIDSTTGQAAAVKVLSAAMAHEEGFRERFEAEIETLKLLRHPNIVHLFGYGEQDGFLFYAMELVEGTNLEDELQRGRRFDWREVTEFGIRLSRALKHAHDRGVIHRDIKPANVLIDRQNEIKLSDFGIAKLFGSSGMTADGGVLGTAEYMSPEQADGRQVTYRCDLYSLGGVLYALLAGRPPFRASTLPEMLQLQRFAQPDPVRRYAPATPTELDAIVTQLLEKSPDARIANAMVLARRLEAMAHGLSVTIAPALPPSEDDHEFVLNSRGGPMETRAADDVVAVPPLSDLSETQVATGIELAPVFDSTPVTVPPPVAAASAVSKPPRPAPARRFTTLAEAEREARAREDVDERVPLVSLGALILVVALVAVGLGIWYQLQPASADSLYRQIAAASVGDGGTELSSVEGEIADFVSRFPNDRRTREVEEHLQEIELARLEKQVQRRLQRVGSSEPISLAEQAYFEAVADSRLDPERGLARFQAMLDLFQKGDSQDRATRDVLRLAQRQVGRMRPSVDAQLNARRQELADIVERARFAQTTDREQAIGMLRAIVELYGDRRWAADSVAQAQQLLLEIESPASAAAP